MDTELENGIFICHLPKADYMNLSKIDVLLVGQLVTSRTETVEDYLRERVHSLSVIGITSPFAMENVSRCSFYERGKLVKESKLASYLLKHGRWYKQPLLLVSFGLYLFSIIFSALHLKKKFSLFIGVACFSTTVGLFLKKIGIVENVIFYSIDYAIPAIKFSPEMFTRKIFGILDKYCAKHADFLWHLSPRIPEGRYKYAGIPETQYKHTLVPLGYSSKLVKSKVFEDIERWTIGFVGTLSENQGLQLLIEAMPAIIRQLPEVKVRVIGHGPYANNLKAKVKNSGLQQYFIFHGFIKDEHKMLELISRCAIGIAPWTSTIDNNALFADPGKPKLYAICGVPVIITKGPLIADDIERQKAGISINYDVLELVDAIVNLLKEDELLKKYKDNVIAFSKTCLSETIFDNAFKETGFLYREIKVYPHAKEKTC